MAARPRMFTFGIGIAIIMAISLGLGPVLLGGGEHLAYAKIEDQNTLVIPT